MNPMLSRMVSLRCLPRLLACLVLPLLAVQAGCDPCAGSLTCAEPVLNYEGQTVAPLTGAPAAGVRVVIRRVRGVALTPDSVLLVTDSAGRFVYRVQAREEGEATVSITFRPPPPFEAYAFSEEHTLFTTRARGDLRQLGSWSVGPLLTAPRLSYVGEVLYAGNGAPVANAEVEFQWLAGGILEGSPDNFVVRTDAAGRFAIVLALQDKTKKDGNGPRWDDQRVYARLEIRPPAPLKPFVIPSIQLTPTVLYNEVKLLGRWAIGSRLGYVGEVFNRHSGERVNGAEVTFVRTGGIALQTETFTTRTNADGRFVIQPLPVDSGEVVGDLRIRVSPFREEVQTGIRLRTFQNPTELRFFGLFGIGPRLAYVGEVFDRHGGSRISGAEVTFVRRGGIALQTDSFTTRSNAEGRFIVQPAPLDTGEVVGDLRIRAGSFPEEIRTGIRLRATENATDLPFFGVFGVGPRISYVGDLVWSDGQPASGLRVEFQRTGGIRVDPAPVTAVTGADGRFLLEPRPLEEGTVEGRFVVQTGPGRTEVIPGIRLATFREDAAIRVLGRWTVARP